eukprot:8521633-Alexandrium_andersonii.AAC.1
MRLKAIGGGTSTSDPATRSHVLLALRVVDLLSFFAGCRIIETVAFRNASTSVCTRQSST